MRILAMCMIFFCSKMAMTAPLLLENNKTQMSLIKVFDFDQNSQFSKLRKFKTGAVIVEGNMITIEFEESDCNFTRNKWCSPVPAKRFRFISKISRVRSDCNGYVAEASGQDGDQLFEVKLMDFSTCCTRNLMPHELFLELKIIDLNDSSEEKKTETHRFDGNALRYLN